MRPDQRRSRHSECPTGSARGARSANTPTCPPHRLGGNRRGRDRAAALPTGDRRTAAVSADSVSRPTAGSGALPSRRARGPRGGRHAEDRRGLSREIPAVLAVTGLTAVSVPAVLLSGSSGPVTFGGLVVTASVWLLFRDRGEGRTSAMIGVVAAFALCGLAPAAVVGLTPDPSSRSWLAALLISVGVGLRLAWIIGDGVQRLVESMVWIFVYTFLGLALLVQLRRGTDPETTPFIDHSLDAEAMTIVIVGSVALGLGVLAGRLRAPLSRRAPAELRISPPRVTVLTLFALTCTSYYIAKLGLGTVFASRTELGQVAAATWGDPTVFAIVKALAAMPLLVAFVALQLERASGLSSGWGRRRLLPIVTGGVLLIVVNPISNARYTSGTIYLAVLASVGLVATRPRFRTLVAGFLASIIFVFPFADAFRYSTTAEFKASDPLSALTTGDFDAYAQVVNTVEYVQAHGITWGYQALGPLLFWIPRSVWPDKPMDTGILLAESRGYGFTNLSAPLWSELFINGGWFVLFAGMFVFGILVRTWDTSIIRTLRRSRLPGLYACILPFYLLILLRGSLLQATAALAVIISAAWFVLPRARSRLEGQPSSEGRRQLPSGAVRDAGARPVGAGARSGPPGWDPDHLDAEGHLDR